MPLRAVAAVRLLAHCGALVAFPAGAANDDLKPGRGVFRFDGWAGEPLRVFYALPAERWPGLPIVVVLHGASRAAERYRDDWHEQALALGFAVFAPEFPKRLYPGREGYVLGNRTLAEGTPVPKAEWTFSAIEPLFDHVRQRLGSRREAYLAYGHSGGCQFLHRFLYAYPRARVAAAVCANAGWYTVPDFGVDHPYGLRGAGVSKAGLERVFATRFTLLLGDRDVDSRHESLNRTSGALVQGRHRFARGHHFFFEAVRRAQAMGVALNWSLAIVPGVAHDNAGMARLAAPLLVLGPASNR